MSLSESKARLDAVHLSDSLRTRLVDFCVSSNFVRDQNLEAVCRHVWSGAPEKGGLSSDIWVESAIPPEASDETLETLQDEGYLSPWLVKHLAKTGEFPIDRLLYLHQAKAVRACAPEEEDRPAVILTAGTGSGKTESFLLPMLSDLAEQPRTPGGGCRAIILYPMNALVNDQVERLYEWLKGQTKLHICHFTGETPEDHAEANRELIPPYQECRHRTRRRARGLEDMNGKKLGVQERTAPPDILITNYSMLEYMLCRPQDQVFFGKDLRTIVLDEAHLYTGTLAAEITLLLRRLYLKCGVHQDQVLQFATSATIGRGSDEELRSFASTLFSKAKESVLVIAGKKAKSELPEAIGQATPPESLAEGFELPTMVLDANGSEALLRSEEVCDRLIPILNGFVSSDLVAAERAKCEGFPARLLRVLRYAPALHTVEQTLRDEKKKQISLGELTAIVWGADTKHNREATSLLIGLASSARESLDSSPLLPHRLHLMLRPAEGISVCLNEHCTGPSDRKLSGLGTVNTSQKELCAECGHRCLPVYRCECCGDTALVGDEIAGDIRPPVDPRKPGTVLQTSPDSEKMIDSQTGNLLSGNLPVVKIEQCPVCSEDKRTFKPIECHGGMVLSILAETTLAALPPLPAKDPGANSILPAQGRRLLAFSDSRSEAAKLGPRLRRQHDLQLVRAAIVRVFLSQPSNDVGEVDALKEEIEQIKRRLKDPEIMPGARKRAESSLAELMVELGKFSSGGGVKVWADLLREREAEALAQILDDARGEKHQADEWQQIDWKRNKELALQKAEELLANELVRLRKRHYVSVETIGVVEVVYPGLEEREAPAELLGRQSQEVREALRANWTKLLAISCDWLRENGAVTLGSWQKDVEWRQDNVHIGAWMDRPTFVGKKGEVSRSGRRDFLRTVFARVGVEESKRDDLAVDVLEALFDCLHAGASSESPELPSEPKFEWLRKERQVRGNESFDGLQLQFFQLALRRPAQLYRCERTGHVWSREVLGCAPAKACDGTLRAVTEADIQQSSFVGRARREYQADSLVFKLGLWAEEHSAQLSSKEARRLQGLFQKGLRNVLSATTTLELGIDIGGLSGTLLSNVPPGKANYLQRAGRVGRRADGSSVVITCARSRPYDREVFQRIGDFLSRDLREPMVFLGRERIVRRHFHSWLMGSFFEQLYDPLKDNVGAMNAFGRMGNFCGAAEVEFWKNSVSKPTPNEAKPIIKGDFPKPIWWKDRAKNGLISQFLAWVDYAAEQGFEDEIDALFRGTYLEPHGLRDNLFQLAKEHFEAGIEGWRNDYRSLMQAWKETTSQEQRQANHLCFKLNSLYKLTVIETLANSRYLPRYGFPIGVLKLQVRVPAEETAKRYKQRSRVEDQYRLDRSSLLALREYVPGSQLLAGGKLVTSRGIAKHWSGDRTESSVGLMGKSAKCINNHFFYWISDEAPDQCPICEDKILGKPDNLIFPRFGFTSAAWDPPKRSVDVDRVGTVVAATTAFATKSGEEQATGQDLEDFAGVPKLHAAYREEGELMVFNRGDNNEGFAICTRCGYAESEPKNSRGKLPTRSLQNHAPIDASEPFQRCREDEEAASFLRHQTLCAKEPTDIALVDPSHYARGGSAKALVTGLSVALKIAGARMLQLDSRELGCMVVPAGERGRGYGAVIYDTVPGGAGHCLELLGRGREWLQATREFLHGGEEHHRTCEHACLDCILTFDAQTLLDQNNLRLDRRDVLDLLDTMLGQTVESSSAPSSDDEPDEVAGFPVLTMEDITPGSPERFVLRLPTNAVSKQFEKGSWCVFRRPRPGEELPTDKPIVIAAHARISDAEFGVRTIRRLRHKAMQNKEEEFLLIKLESRADGGKRYANHSFELRGEEMVQWQPLAILERSVSHGDTTA